MAGRLDLLLSQVSYDQQQSSRGLDEDKGVFRPAQVYQEEEEDTEEQGKGAEPEDNDEEGDSGIEDEIELEEGDVDAADEDSNYE